jgi:hypothetical protein
MRRQEQPEDTGILAERIEGPFVLSSVQMSCRSDTSMHSIMVYFSELTRHQVRLVQSLVARIFVPVDLAQHSVCFQHRDKVLSAPVAHVSSSNRMAEIPRSSTRDETSVDCEGTNQCIKTTITLPPGYLRCQA